MENTICMENRKLALGLIAGILISVGIILSEKSLELETGTSNFMPGLGAGIFILGWIILLSTQKREHALIGALVFITAMAGQIYMGWVLSKDTDYRRSMLLYTMGFWALFIGIWIYYAYRLSEGNTNRKYYIFIGLFLLMAGMMGYFFYRKSDWNTLTAGLIPSITKDGSIFNQFVILVPFAWALIAIGNAIL